MSEVYPNYNADPDDVFFRFDPDAIADVVDEVISNGFNSFHQYKVTELFLRLFCSHIDIDAENEKTTLAQICTNQAQKYTKANIHTSITVNELARQLGISQPHLYRLFKSRFHISPKEYIIDQK